MPKVSPGAGATSGRRGRGRRVASSLAEINVVPLVDVMLVLLIIFMVAAPMMQHGLDVNLPVSRRAPELSESRLYVTVPEPFARERVVRLNDDRVRLDALGERVRQALLNQTEKQVFLAGDGAVTLQQLLEVMDRLKDAGVERVGIVARTPGPTGR